MNDQTTGFEAQGAHKTSIGLSSHQISHKQTDRIEKFTQTIRLLAHESLGTSRYSLLLEGHKYVVLVNPKEHYHYAIDKKLLFS
ncbi:MAG: hypothetical protein ACFFGZ_06245 [Candidatus Thorarchaeota archaeon]